MAISLEDRVKQYIRDNDLIREGDRVLAGCSGGADSVCLLLVLQSLSTQMSFSLGAFHLNHGIRGEEAERDAEYAEGLCRKLGIPFTLIHRDVPAMAALEKKSLEEAGREARLLAAEELAKEKGYTKIALAHQQNDVAETFLFRLFRGSSAAGLASIAPKRGNIIRPLLFCERAEIEAYLREKEIPFCTDSTNSDVSYARNRIRHRILPEAEKVNTGAARHIAETAQELLECAAYLEEQAEMLVKSAQRKENEIAVPVAGVEALPKVIRQKVVYRLLCEAAGSHRDITREHVDSVCRLLQGQSGRKVCLPYGVSAKRRFEYLVFCREKATETREFRQPVRVCPQGCVTVQSGDSEVEFSFSTFPYLKKMEIPKNECTKWFDYGKIKGALWIRSKQPKDRIGLLQGFKSVKSVLTEKKIASEERDSLCMLADDTQVLWIPGVRSCDNCRVDDTTTTVLQVSYQIKRGKKDEGQD